MRFDQSYGIVPVQKRALCTFANKISASREGADVVVFDEAIALELLLRRKTRLCDSLVGDRELIEKVNEAQKRHNSWHVFMVCHRSGHWSLPKGHPEPGETPLMSAKRELYEETGLEVETLLFEAPLIEHYQFTKKRRTIDKQVDYFVAQVSGDIVIQLDEIVTGNWFSFENALDRATYPEMKSLLNKVRHMLPE